MKRFYKDADGWGFWCFEWARGDVFSMFWIGRLAIDHTREYHRWGIKIEWY